MSDELIARLRRMAEPSSCPDDTDIERDSRMAADALEAAQEKITTLENMRRCDCHLGFMPGELQIAKDKLEAAREMIKRLEADAERYAFLRSRLFGADWNWNDEDVSVILFLWPKNASIWSDLDAAIDAARKES